MSTTETVGRVVLPEAILENMKSQTTQVVLPHRVTKLLELGSEIRGLSRSAYARLLIMEALEARGLFDPNSPSFYRDPSTF